MPSLPASAHASGSKRAPQRYPASMCGTRRCQQSSAGFARNGARRFVGMLRSIRPVEAVTTGDQMHRFMLAAVLGVMCSGVVHADVRADEKTQVKFEGMLGRMLN